MSKRIGSYPRLRVSGGGNGVITQGGGVLLVETARRTGLDAALSAALAPWRKPRAVHDPGKILLDLALAVALGRNAPDAPPEYVPPKRPGEGEQMSLI